MQLKRFAIPYALSLIEFLLTEGQVEKCYKQSIEI
jgi:hypothetical protein